MLVEEKATIIIRFNTDLVRAKTYTKDALLDQKEIVGDGALLGLEEELLSRYKLENTKFLEVTKEVKKSRD